MWLEGSTVCEPGALRWSCDGNPCDPPVYRRDGKGVISASCAGALVPSWSGCDKYLVLQHIYDRSDSWQWTRQLLLKDDEALLRMLPTMVARKGKLAFLIAYRVAPADCSQTSAAPDDGSGRPPSDATKETETNTAVLCSSIPQRTKPLCHSIVEASFTHFKSYTGDDLPTELRQVATDLLRASYPQQHEMQLQKNYRAFRECISSCAYPREAVTNVLAALSPMPIRHASGHEVVLVRLGKLKETLQRHNSPLKCSTGSTSEGEAVFRLFWIVASQNLTEPVVALITEASSMLSGSPIANIRNARKVINAAQFYPNGSYLTYIANLGERANYALSVANGLMQKKDEGTVRDANTHPTDLGYDCKQSLLSAIDDANKSEYAQKWRSDMARQMEAAWSPPSLDAKAPPVAATEDDAVAHVAATG